jgi:hypothetical protein
MTELLKEGNEIDNDDLHTPSSKRVKTTAEFETPVISRRLISPGNTIVLPEDPSCPVFLARLLRAVNNNSCLIGQMSLKLETVHSESRRARPPSRRAKKMEGEDTKVSDKSKKCISERNCQLTFKGALSKEDEPEDSALHEELQHNSYHMNRYFSQNRSHLICQMKRSLYRSLDELNVALGQYLFLVFIEKCLMKNV